METTPYLRPTALQHMRGFLAESGAGLPPWSTNDEVLDELVGLLHLHRDDDAFFSRLAPFVRELREHASRGAAGLTAGDAEVLSRATVESIVEELQRLLRRSSRSASARVVSNLLGPRASRLLCLALLSSGLVACSQRPADPGSAGEPGTVAPPVRPAAPSAAGEPGTPPPAAPTPAAAAPAPASSGLDALVDIFRAQSPQEAAQELEKIIDGGTPGLEQPVRPKAIQNFGDNSVPLYKGVNLT